MAVAVDKTAQRFLNIATGVDLNCAFPCFAATDVEVFYGIVVPTLAVLNTDYTVTLNEIDGYENFIVTPLAALLTKINAVIAADLSGTEINYATVRREMDFLTSTTPETVRYTSFLSLEFDRMVLRMQQLEEAVSRSVTLAPNNVGDIVNPITVPVAVPGAALIWSEDGASIVNGPDAADLERVEVIAVQAAADAVTASTGAATAATQAAIATAGAATVTTAVAAEAALRAAADALLAPRASPTFTGTVTTPNLNGGQLAGFRNRIINGAMRIDQRNEGASRATTTSLAYCIDRFLAGTTGANATGQRIDGNAPDRSLYQFTGAASVTSIAFQQRIDSDNIYDLAGTTVTLSAKLANSLLTTVTWGAYYANSTDNWSGQTLIATGTFTVTSVLTKFSTQIALPANAINGVQIIFSVGSQISGTWTIGEIQLENGSVATPFERRPIGAELGLCQRYYESGFGGTVSYASSGAAVQYTSAYFKQTKRASPTVTVTFVSGGASAPVAVTVDTGQIFLSYSAPGAGQTLYFSFTASAEL